MSRRKWLIAVAVAIALLLAFGGAALANTLRGDRHEVVEVPDCCGDA